MPSLRSRVKGETIGVADDEGVGHGLPVEGENLKPARQSVGALFETTTGEVTMYDPLLDDSREFSSSSSLSSSS